MADVIPFPDAAERARRCEAKVARARLEAEYAGLDAPTDYRDRGHGYDDGHAYDPDDVDWLHLSDFEPRPNAGSGDGPYDPLLEALIELMETDADDPHSG